MDILKDIKKEILSKMPKHVSKKNIEAFTDELLRGALEEEEELTKVYKIVNKGIAQTVENMRKGTPLYKNTNKAVIEMLNGNKTVKFETATRMCSYGEIWYESGSEGIGDIYVKLRKNSVTEIIDNREENNYYRLTCTIGLKNERPVYESTYTTKILYENYSVEKITDTVENLIKGYINAYKDAAR